MSQLNSRPHITASVQPSPSPNELYCAHCDRVSTRPRSVTPGELPAIGSLYLCSSCGEVSTLTLQGWTKLTHDELKALPSEERDDLEFAVRAIKANIHKQ